MQDHNHTAEAGLIACLLDAREGAATAYHCAKCGITAASFTDGRFSDLFHAAQTMRQKGQAVSRSALWSRIHADGGDPAEMMAKVPTENTSAVFAYGFAADVRSAQTIRAAREAIDRIGGMVRCGDTAQDIVGEFQRSALELCGQDASTIHTLATERADKIEQWRQAKSRGYVGVPSWCRQINHAMGGYRPGVMTVLGAFRGTGKSTFARQECYHKAHDLQMPCALLSMEDPADVAAAGIVGALKDFSVFHMDVGAHELDLDDVDARWRDVENIPLHIVSRGMNIDQIATTLTGLRAAKNIGFAVIDHIQFIRAGKSRHGSRNDEVAHYSGVLSDLAKTLGIPLLVCSQLSRDSEKEARTPRLSDLRDSGAIEQDARQVMLLYRDPVDGSVSKEAHELHIAKNNYGAAGEKIRLWREDGRQRFKVRA